jgi:hypothetical protein
VKRLARVRLDQAKARKAIPAVVRGVQEFLEDPAFG